MIVLRWLALALLVMPVDSAEPPPELPTWMAGSWVGTVDGVEMEEHWTSPGGDVMLGMHRDVRPGKPASFEFLRIERGGDTLIYQAMPGGRPATPFRLESITKSRVVFANLEHDFPQRIIYWETNQWQDARRLCARVEGSINGKLESEEWCWRPKR